MELAGSEADPDGKKVAGLIEAFSHYGVEESRLPAVDRVEVAGTPGEPLRIGSILQLTATLYDADGNELDRPVEWTSSDEAVAEVDRKGLVTALARGEVTVTATAEGVGGEAVLQVRGEPTGAYGNNLSHPVVFARGIGVTGLDVTEDSGLRPTPEEEISVDALPFFWEGNEPDWGDYHMQKGPDVRQAEWADGRDLEWPEEAVVAWGDNLTHHSWNTHSMLRVENVLYAEGVEPMQGYAMTWLYGEGPDEMQGTDGTLLEGVPTVHSVMPRLTIEKLEGTDPAGEPGAPVCEIFDGAAHEGLGTDGPGSYSSEVNVAGKVLYGFNFVIRDVEICPDMHRYGWWRITFSLDEQGSVGGAAIQRAVDLVGLEAADEEMIYTPRIDPATNTTWLDIYVESARGGGGGGH